MSKESIRVLITGAPHSVSKEIAAYLSRNKQLNDTVRFIACISLSF
jgi:hypothetical protein